MNTPESTFSKTEEKIIKIITKTISLNNIKISNFSRLNSDIGLGSLDTYEVFMNLETDFGIEIPSFISTDISISNLASYIDTAVQRQAIKENMRAKTHGIKK